jgi:hypothetical protein
MNIYKVEQDWNNGYDTYSDFVCIAENEQAARETHPSEYVTHNKDGKWYGTYSRGGEYEQDGSDWVSFDEIGRLEVTLIGVANADQNKGVVCASFHAG